MNKLERAYKIWLDDRFSEKVVVKSFVCLYMKIDFADYDVNVSDECVWVRVYENHEKAIEHFAKELDKIGQKPMKIIRKSQYSNYEICDLTPRFSILYRVGESL